MNCVSHRQSRLSLEEIVGFRPLLGVRRLVAALAERGLKRAMVATGRDRPKRRQGAALQGEALRSSLNRGALLRARCEIGRVLHSRSAQSPPQTLLVLTSPAYPS